ncbi:hypothetical protein KA005_69355 [bacterium]|nr:hypothetical protein [bacterium]
MFRNIDVSHDPLSWGSNPVPSIIAGLPTTRLTNIWAGLMHTALRTSPPIRHGFHLSDFWAWFRYFNAFSNTKDLRLRPEWKDIDPHQKGLLGDELGMGLTTQLLAEKVGIVDFVDTIYYLRVINPRALNFIRRPTRGPRKSPDFIGLDSSNKIYVIECKGTQSSRKELFKNMNGGVPQKTNIGANIGHRIHSSLVAGLFIPQYENRDNALIHIMDPNPDFFESLFSNISTETMIRAISQISLAKHFSFIGLRNISAYLLKTPTLNLGKLSEEYMIELKSWLKKTLGTNILVTIENPLFKKFSEANLKTPKRLEINTPTSLLELLLKNRNMTEMLDELIYTHKQDSWKTVDSNFGISIHSPYGFEYVLST